MRGCYWRTCISSFVDFILTSEIRHRVRDILEIDVHRRPFGQIFQAIRSDVVAICRRRRHVLQFDVGADFVCRRVHDCICARTAPNVWSICVRSFTFFLQRQRARVFLSESLDAWVHDLIIIVCCATWTTPFECCSQLPATSEIFVLYFHLDSSINAGFKVRRRVCVCVCRVCFNLKHSCVSCRHAQFQHI